MGCWADQLNARLAQGTAIWAVLLIAAVAFLRDADSAGAQGLRIPHSASENPLNPHAERSRSAITKASSDNK